ncbi:hypothetical protein [Streptomyces inhibens]|uniref:hypothetical protein n=1 Tax=Streptomyces inhibens TaxID=2293571 RepID=UPI000FFCA4B7|nr:hypothetical protein [Streptomyces inhibens]
MPQSGPAPGPDSGRSPDSASGSTADSVPRAPAGARPLPAWQGFLLALGTLVPVALGLWAVCVAPHVNHVGLQFAGSAAAADKVVDDHTSDFRTALSADYAFIAGYTATLLLVFRLGRHVFAGRRGRRAARWAMIATLLAAGCDVAENVLLTYGLHGGADGSDGPFALATGCATVKWLLLAVIAVVALIVWGTTTARAARAILRKLCHKLWHTVSPHVMPLQRLIARLTPAANKPAPPCPRHPDAPGVVPPWPVAHPDGTRWPAAAPQRAQEPADPPGDGTTDGPAPGTTAPPAHWRYEGEPAPGRTNAPLGFCVSGGGIRSACVTLGALQALRSSLLKARYLVAVSGGGYTVGAMQLALVGPDNTPAPISSADAFAPGSPEEDHLRRHSKYVADGAGQWLVALGVLLRGLLASLFLLTATTVTLGLALSWAYHLVPVTELAYLAEPGTRLCVKCAPPDAPAFRGASIRAVLIVLGTSMAVWLLWLLAYAWCRFDAVVQGLARAFQALVLLTVALAAGVLVLPVLAWGAVFLQTQLDVSRPDATAAAGATVLLTYIAALVSTLWRRRQTIRRGLGKVLDLVRGRPGLSRAVPNGLTQYIVVWAVLLLLGAAFLFLLGWATATGWSWPAWAQIGIPATLLFIGASLDQTWMSLHPFYRRRLASAFAVRRVIDNGAGHAEMAVPYDFTTETTTLSTYGDRKPDFPQVIFAAAANLSGSERTPPGRRAVSFTLSHDYVGGPDVGYACTACLEQRTKRHIVHDLTVQSAVAISGAAFSSAMGAQARAFQTLFALSNARLGTWLPNPGAMAELWKNHDVWELPPPPAIRRLPYLLREVFGRFPMDDRLLLVTDGGHYENLGLVELLRQGVHTAVCIDASGDSPPFATTLAQAIALAHEELGITIKLHRPTTLAPGSGKPLQPASTLSALNSRLSQTAVITGDIIYPKNLTIPGRPPSARGTLIVARATLTDDLPYQLLSYASAHPVFPHDSTSDQWFDHQQFDAYQTLGQALGTHVQALLAPTKPKNKPEHERS